MGHTKVLIIGLDGATFDLISPWVGEGKLPHLGQLMTEGVHRDLRSTVPPMTFPAWNSFMTGMNPGKHGLYDFMERKPGTFELEVMNATHRKKPTFWEIAGKHKKRCAIIGVPVTYPPQPLNGILISGFDAPYSDRRIMYPASLYAELVENVGPYIVSANLKSYLKDGNLDETIETICQTIDRKGDTARYIFRKENWDLKTIVFGESDLAIHYFWKFHDKDSPLSPSLETLGTQFDPIFKIYERIDFHIGRLLSDIDEDTTVLVVSDHGAGGTGLTNLYLNNFLATQGLLEFKKVSLRFLQKRLDFFKSLIRIILPKSMVKLLRFGKFNTALKIESSLRYSGIDWSRTKVFADENYYHPGIFINLKGREKYGIVQTDEFEHLVEQVIEIFTSWKNPQTNENIVTFITRRADIYEGENQERFPDLIISWNTEGDYSYLFKPSFTEGTLCPLRSLSDDEITHPFMLNHTGSHRDLGVCILHGPSIKKNVQLNEANIIDIAPTVCYLLDIPVPKEMDGAVLLDSFHAEGRVEPQYSTVTVDHPPQPSQSLPTDESDLIRKRLKDLGYLQE